MNPRKSFNILSLDGGGSKGVYTLGVLKEVEAKFGPPHETFDLIFGTSTGSIIGTLLALGRTTDQIHKLYCTHVPAVMGKNCRKDRSAALASLSEEIFHDTGFDKVQTDVGIVATKWNEETPMIFKSDHQQAHGRKSSFVPGFGVSLGEAIQASCSAYPYFEKKVITLSDKSNVTLIDGGYCANNPTLFAISDAVAAYGISRDQIRVLNVGVGDYPTHPIKKFSKAWFLTFVEEAELTQKTFNINSHSIDQLRSVLFADIKTVRISEAFTHPSMATDLLEFDEDKLNLIYRRGRESFGKQEHELEILFE